MEPAHWQSRAEDALARTGRPGSVVVLRVADGEVLARAEHAGHVRHPSSEPMPVEKEIHAFRSQPSEPREVRQIRSGALQKGLSSPHWRKVNARIVFARNRQDVEILTQVMAATGSIVICLGVYTLVVASSESRKTGTKIA